MRYTMHTTLLLIGVGGLMPISLAAQRVQVQVRSENAARQYPIAILSLEDTEGRVVAVSLSDSLGEATLQAPGPGTYVVRADRVGHRTTISLPIGLQGNEVLASEVQFPMVPILASSFVIEESGNECGDPGLRTPALRAAWAEARKVLVAVEITRSSVLVQRQVRRFERLLDAGGHVKDETDMGTGYTHSRPFTIIPPDRVWREGFVGAKGDLALFHAPDAEHLLTDGFEVFHCFALQRGSGSRKGWVGIAFQPTPIRNVGEIAGVVWLDQASVLREMEFRYTDPEYPKAVSRASGRITFVEVPFVGWIESGWSIRVATIEVSGGDRAGGARFPDRERIIGFVENGGSVRVVGRNP